MPPSRSRVQFIARVAPRRALSRFGPPVPVVKLYTRTRARTCRTSSNAPHSLPFRCVFTSRHCMRNSKGQQIGHGIGQGATNTHPSSGAKRYNTVNCAGYFGAKCNLDPLELKFWKDFWTCDSHHQALTFALF